MAEQLTTLTKYDGEFHHEVWGDSYALFWYAGDDLFAIEPYAQYGDGTVHFYNRIAGSELDEFLSCTFTVYNDKEDLLQTV